MSIATKKTASEQAATKKLPGNKGTLKKAASKKATAKKTAQKRRFAPSGMRIHPVSGLPYIPSQPGQKPIAADRVATLLDELP